MTQLLCTEIYFLRHLTFILFVCFCFFRLYYVCVIIKLDDNYLWSLLLSDHKQQVDVLLFFVFQDFCIFLMKSFANFFKRKIYFSLTQIQNNICCTHSNNNNNNDDKKE